jgi:hypothetical protein
METSGVDRVLVWFARPPTPYFFFANNSRIPFLIASPFVIPFLRQYSCNLLSVSASNLTLNRTSFGFSAFGLPVLGDTCSPHFLSRIKYNIGVTKSQALFINFLLDFSPEE